MKIGHPYAGKIHESPIDLQMNGKDFTIWQGARLIATENNPAGAHT